jgi:hypothetical protein
VFYSFAGDEGTATEVQANADMYVSGFDGSGLSDANGGSSSMVFTVSGVGSEANAKKHFNLLTPYAMQSSNYGNLYYNQSLAALGNPLTVSWNSGYTQLTVSWTNAALPTNTGGYQYLNLMWGAQSTSSAPMVWAVKIDASTKALQTDSLLGLVGLTGDYHIHPPFATSSAGLSAYTSNNTWATGSQGSSARYFRGPKWSFASADEVYNSSARNNTQTSSIESYATGYVTMTVSGADKYMKSRFAPTVGSSHRLYNEIYGSRTQLTVSSATKYYVRWTAPLSTQTMTLGYYGKDESGRINNTSASQPDADTSVNFYFLAGESTAGLMGTHTTHADAQYDIKVTIAMDDRAAGNMSMTVFRSSAALSSPSWTEVDRLYMGGHNIS